MPGFIISQIVAKVLNPLESVVRVAFGNVLEADPAFIVVGLELLEDVAVVLLAIRVRLVSIRCLSNLDMS